MYQVYRMYIMYSFLIYSIVQKAIDNVDTVLVFWRDLPLWHDLVLGTLWMKMEFKWVCNHPTGEHMSCRFAQFRDKAESLRFSSPLVCLYTVNNHPTSLVVSSNHIKFCILTITEIEINFVLPNSIEWLNSPVKQHFFI